MTREGEMEKEWRSGMPIDSCTRGGPVVISRDRDAYRAHLLGDDGVEETYLLQPETVGPFLDAFHELSAGRGDRAVAVLMPAETGGSAPPPPPRPRDELAVLLFEGHSNIASDLARLLISRRR